MNKKIPSRYKLKKVINKLKVRGKKIVFTNGCFDILHRGHIDYIKKAKSLGDVLVVGLNSDISVKKIKENNRPVVNQKDRAEVLAAISDVDFVTIFNEATPLNLIRCIRPDILVKGADWKTEDIVGRDFLLSYGGKVKTIKYLEGYSTTNIINKILSNA